MSQHVECHRCGYGWDYTGNSEYYASCPKCKTSVPLVDDDETRTATADDGAGGNDRSERVDALRDRVAELEETASQLQAAIEAMTEKVTAIEQRKRRAKADAFQAEDAEPERPEGTAETAGDDGIHVAVESDDPAGAPSGAPARGGDVDRQRTGVRPAADAGGSDSPGTGGDGFERGSSAGDARSDAGSPASGDPTASRSDERTDVPPSGPDGADGPGSRATGAGGSGVKPRADEDGSYDYTCPECDGPVSGQPEMCIHCGTSFRWT